MPPIVVLRTTIEGGHVYVHGYAYARADASALLAREGLPRKGFQFKRPALSGRFELNYDHYAFLTGLLRHLPVRGQKSPFLDRKIDA